MLKFRGRNNAWEGAGFTLIETVVGIFIFSIITIGLIVLITDVLSAGNRQGNVLADEDSARKTLFTMIAELRNAQAGSDGSYPLELANPQEIVFFAPVTGSSGIMRVHYYVQNGNLMKGLTPYANSMYATNTESSIVVARNVNTAPGALFNYYDGTYTGAPGQNHLASPVNVTQAKFVKINLSIFNTAGVSNTNYFTMSAGAAIRSLKTNLGQ